MKRVLFIAFFLLTASLSAGITDRAEGANHYGFYLRFEEGNRIAGHMDLKYFIVKYQTSYINKVIPCYGTTHNY